MWIEKLKSGSLRAVERYRIDGKWKRVSVPIPKDTAQARRKAQEALEAKIKAIGQPEKEMPLNELIELYISKKDCKESTRDTERKRLNGALKLLDGIPFEPASINRCFMESTKRSSTINQYVEALRALVHWGFRYGYVEEDFALRIFKVKDKTPKTPSEEKYLEPDELKEALDKMNGMYKYMCHFLALSGCRVGEASALTWDDIYDGYIHITKTDSKYGVTTPKTRSSVRDIFIQEELQELLNDFRQWRNLYMMSLGVRSDRLFFTRTGSHVLSKELGWYLNQIDFHKHLHPHIFRHTHTALLAEQGMSLEAISRRLGHHSSHITKEVYFHVTSKLKKRDEEAIRYLRIL